MNDKVYTIEYLEELQKLTESLERIYFRIDKHINRVLTSQETAESTLLSRREAAEYLGISMRQFDRRAKTLHFWQYKHQKLGQVYYDIEDFKLSREELKEKFVKGVLSKQIDVNCKVIKGKYDLKVLKGGNGLLAKEIRKKLEE